jgi:3-hydroxyisobutyrate dehydrogenase-like beta-hydroxyacid dehydrogenase
MEKERIGFIGLGNMGSRMARRIIAAGYALTVCDTDENKTRVFEQQNVQRAGTPYELAGRSEAILCSVPDDAAVREVVTGRNGVLAASGPLRYFVDLSTVSPANSRELAKAGRERGVSMIDAAVSGSTPQAEQGALVVFTGGVPDACEHVRPILDVFSSSVHYMGPSGSGSAMKLVVNTLLGVGIQAIAEAIALGQKAGLPKDRLLDVLGQTAVVAPGHKGKLAKALRDEYQTTFPLRLMYKDFGLILEEAAEQSVPMPTTAVARQICAAEMVKGFEEDYSAVIRLMEQLAGIDTASSGARITRASGKRR